ncbi:MAG: hypothetical protein JJLCMIEE_01290 [Acidimicrobiales bacterium]|nr:hypothetical protein [Acidimicrobiales bacterium]
MLKNVLVTGTSTGIGEATALHLDELGYRVFAGVRRDADAESLAERGSERLHPVIVDVTDESRVETVLDDIRSIVGPAGLHGVVNNAAIAVGGPIEYLPLDYWRRQFEVNVVGLVSVTRLAMPLVRDALGRVILVGSIGGKIATPMLGPYSASKFAVEAIADCLRMEMADFGISVSLIEPGHTRSAIRAKGLRMIDDLEEQLPAEALERYRPRFERIRIGLESPTGDGTDPLVVAGVIARALRTGYPKPRYAVGRDAKLGAALARLLPDRARDALLRRLAATIE